MIRRFTGQLPTWARPEHPVLRYELGASQRASWKARYARALGVVLLAGLLLLGGYFIATRLLQNPAGENFVEALNNTLFWPLLAVQLVLRILAVTLTSNTVADEIRRQKKQFGLIIADISGGQTNTTTYDFQAFKGVPRIVYRVDGKTGKETLVRGVEFARAEDLETVGVEGVARAAFAAEARAERVEPGFVALAHEEVAQHDHHALAPARQRDRAE